MSKSVCATASKWSFTPKLLPSAKRRIALARREEWLRQLHPGHLFHRLFDLIPGLYFFAKNSRGETMFCSEAILHLYKLSDENQIVGLTDFDLNPATMAQSYVEDDAKIYRNGRPLLNRVELWFNEEGMPDWYVVNKLPMRDRDGRIIGVMGFLQSYAGRAKLLPPFGKLTKSVDYIRTHFQEKICIAQLARAASLSQRQLERKFRTAFGVSPHTFVIKTRVLAACQSLRETELSLTEIAVASGFSDQSAFVHHFRRHIGVTPGLFRRGITPQPTSRR